jgi:fructose-1,6-bisphosphatase/inositol monophosphatase family enzyme
MPNPQGMKSSKLDNYIISFFKSLPKEISYELKRNKLFKINNKKKNTFDPVTTCDRNIEKLLRRKINKSFKNHNILGEEIKSKKTKSEFTWVLDPIDGTKNFIMGIPTWSNLIGLFYKNKSLISLANFPLLKKYYLAYNNKVFKFENNKKILVKSNDKLKKNPSIVVNTSRTLRSLNVKKLQKNFKGIFRVSGIDALNFCLLSEGKIDVIIERGLKKVDYLPLLSIIENSGASISDWKGKNNFKYGDVLISANKKLHKKILKIL